MKLSILKLHPNAQVPQYATEGASAFDLHAHSNGLPSAWVLHREGGVAIIGTGLAFEIPDGHVMLVFSRSGHGFKSDVSLVNSVGVIDADFRGEVRIGLRNDGALPFTVKPGDRIAQALILPVPRVEFEVKDKLTEALRGQKGIGSTGA